MQRKAAHKREFILLNMSVALLLRNAGFRLTTKFPDQRIALRLLLSPDNSQEVRKFLSFLQICYVMSQYPMELRFLTAGKACVSLLKKSGLPDTKLSRCCTLSPRQYWGSCFSVNLISKLNTSSERNCLVVSDLSFWTDHVERNKK